MTRSRGASIVEAEEDKLPVINKPKVDPKASKYHFKRINVSTFAGTIDNKFVDNSFEAKERFGQGGDSYGSWSNSKLADKKGASFIKEKNKMKKR